MLNPTFILACMASLACTTGGAAADSPDAFGLPYCLQGDKVTCQFAILTERDLSHGGSLPLFVANTPIPAIGSVEFRRLPDDGSDGGSSRYILVLYLETPQDLPR